MFSTITLPLDSITTKRQRMDKAGDNAIVLDGRVTTKFNKLEVGTTVGGVIVGLTTAGGAFVGWTIAGGAMIVRWTIDRGTIVGWTIVGGAIVGWTMLEVRSLVEQSPEV